MIANDRKVIASDRAIVSAIVYRRDVRERVCLAVYGLQRSLRQGLSAIGCILSCINVC